MEFYKNMHENALRELERQGYRWKTCGDFWALQGFHGRELLNWRLWESIENLDIQLWYAKNLLNRTRSVKWQHVRKALKQIVQLFDEALALLDPKHWVGRNKHFLTIEPDEEVVSKVLQNLIHIRRLLFIHRLDLAKVEKRGQCWLAFTFMLYLDVLNSIYGCKKWLETVKNEEKG
ncbi:MAG: hypothetical protein QXL54_03785 [Candidatus Bathyarchaeia archaeon]